MNNQNKHVTILGGGIVGLTSALLLEKLGLQVTLIEAKDLDSVFNSTHSIADSRCSALSIASQILLESIDIWDKISGQHKSAFQHMCVWDNEDNEIRFSASEVATAHLGYIVENHALQKILWESVKSKESIEICTPIRAKEIRFSHDAVILELEDKREITSALLIGAEGRRSWLREKMHIEVQDLDYHQIALSATVVTEKPHQKTAWQRFTDIGPLAFLPLSDPYQCSIVWSVYEKYAHDMFSLPDQMLCEKIAEAFQYRLGQVKEICHKETFPLHRLQAKQYVKERVALLGDAAHVIHPMVGQGLNLGFLNINELLKVIQQSINNKQDIGSYMNLRKFERASKYRVFELMSVIESLKYVFEASSGPISVVRGVGLSVTNQLSFLKKMMMRYAMGIEAIESRVL